MAWPFLSSPEDHKSKAVSPPSSQPGIHVTHWFWASLQTMVPKNQKKVSEGMSEPASWVGDEDIWDKAKKSVDPEGKGASYDDPWAVVADVYKKMGGTIKKGKEADAASSFPQTFRQKESNKSRTQANFKFNVRFVEKSKSAGTSPNKFTVALIEEGLGNFGDAYYYTKNCIESAVKIFEGKKIFVDHPDEVEEQTRPERSVRDVCGHYENLSVGDADGGKSCLVGDVVVVQGPAFEKERALMEHAVEYSQKYPDQSFIGLSINANGEAQETDIHEFMQSGQVPQGAVDKLNQAIAQGIQTIRVVNEIASAVSCDLVTEAGAGGKILAMLEKQKQKEKEMAKQKENEGAPAGVKPAEGAVPPAPGAAPAAPASHDDEQQDVALIKKMLDEYLGSGEHGEEEEKQAHEAYKMAKQAGMHQDEAMKCVGHSMKMAKMMHAHKQAEEAGAVPPAAPAAPAQKQESETVAKLMGRIAKLEEASRITESAEHLDKILKESKLPVKVTTKFREAVKGCKSKAEIDTKFKAFMEGYQIAEAGRADADGFYVTPEKTELGDDSGSLSLADCVD